jgi:hypothetical protein
MMNADGDGEVRQAPLSEIRPSPENAAQTVLEPVCIEGTRVRKAISPAKMPMLAAVVAVLEGVLHDYLPTSVRKIHYELLNTPPLRHASKPDTRYCNTSEWASITASATFGHSASPANVTCWHILALPCAMRIGVKYVDNFCHRKLLYFNHLETHFISITYKKYNKIKGL